MIYINNEQSLCFVISDLGVHIDGFIAAVAFTIVVGATKVGILFLF